MMVSESMGAGAFGVAVGSGGGVEEGVSRVGLSGVEVGEGEGAIGIGVFEAANGVCRSSVEDDRLG